MTTKLDKPLKREVSIEGVPYTVTLTPDGLKIVGKGKRTGREFGWGDLVGGSVTLTRDLEDSIAQAREPGEPDEEFRSDT